MRPHLTLKSKVQIASCQKKPHFSEAFPEATIREGADELTLRAGGAFINTEHIELKRWRPPLVDTHWHAFCQSIDKGIEGKEWDELYYHHREMSQATGAKSRVRVKK